VWNDATPPMLPQASVATRQPRRGIAQGSRSSAAESPAGSPARGAPHRNSLLRGACDLCRRAKRKLYTRFAPVCKNDAANVPMCAKFARGSMASAPGEIDGTLLARVTEAAGQHPAKRFPSRARAGPNAGLAAPIKAVEHGPGDRPNFDDARLPRVQGVDWSPCHRRGGRRGQRNGDDGVAVWRACCARLERRCSAFRVA
jgi:hypothetical protein